MIKVKILNPTKDRNEPTFRPLFFVKDMLVDYSIDITESDDYDFLFIGMTDFLNPDLLLKDSIDWGLENIQKYTNGGEYFLFDGSDSHSLMTSYDIFSKSDATYLFKNQLHKDKSRYNIPKAFNKWFFGSGSKLDLSYNIPDDVWDKIKLTGWNFMNHVPDHKNFIPINENKTIDICAIFDGGGDTPTPAHGVSTHLLYKSHRQEIIDKLNKISKKYTIVTGKKSWQDYMQVLYNSKICISPFGMGEIRQGDGECIQAGTTIFKENMSGYDFGANVWIENKTYIPFEYDCSNLLEQIDMVLSDYNNFKQINKNMRDTYLEQYDTHKLCLHWYNIFSNLKNIKEVD